MAMASLLRNATVISRGRLNGGTAWSDNLVRTKRSRSTEIFRLEVVA